MNPRTLPLLLAATLAASSCQATAVAEAPQGKTEDASDSEDSEHEVRVATMNLELEQMGAERSLAAAERAVADAGRELDEARRALEVFDQRESPKELDEAQLSLDRAIHRSELDRDELAELESMYAEEDFAEKTKELVLKRGRKDLEFSQRAVALRELELVLKREVQLPKRRRELEAEVQTAEHELAEAHAKLKEARLEGEKDLLEARHALEEAKKEES